MVSPVGYCACKCRQQRVSWTGMIPPPIVELITGNTHPSHHIPNTQQATRNRQATGTPQPRFGSDFGLGPKTLGLVYPSYTLLKSRFGAWKPPHPPKTGDIGQTPPVTVPDCIRGISGRVRHTKWPTLNGAPRGPRRTLLHTAFCPFGPG